MKENGVNWCDSCEIEIAKYINEDGKVLCKDCMVDDLQYVGGLETWTSTHYYNCDSAHYYGNDNDDDIDEILKDMMEDYDFKQIK